MTWTAPMTAVAGATFTAAEFNTYVRDNLNETGPAKVTVAGQILVSTAANALAARTPDTANVNTSQTTTSTSYTDLTTSGPAVTVTTGAKAFVIITSNIGNNTSGQNAYMSYGITGATSVSATDDRAAFISAAAANQTVRAAQVYMETGLTPGSNTFTAKYRVTANTGTFANRRIAVIPL